MLFDLDYALDGSGRATPRFFLARLDAGIMKIPAQLYREEDDNAVGKVEPVR